MPHDAELLEVAAEVAPLRSGPGADEPLQTELLRGERFLAATRCGAWVAGSAVIDGYAGHVPHAALRLAGPDPTHRVLARATLLYREPKATAEVEGIAWLGSRFRIAEEVDSSFLRTAEGHFVAREHLAPIAARVADPTSIAERFLGAPYRYGGRTGAGLDCSALVQLSLQAAGIDAPRDSAPQSSTLGRRLTHGEPLQRNDLAFWEGHVGMLLDEESLLHANAHHMAVAAEPFREARRRLAERSVAWLGMRRLDGIGASGHRQDRSPGS